MKRWVACFVLGVSFLAQSNNDKLIPERTNPVLAVMDCLRGIPDNEIVNQDHANHKEISLFTSVIENITVELGTNDDEQKEFRALYKVAFKFCPDVISDLKAGYKSKTKS